MTPETKNTLLLFGLMTTVVIGGTICITILYSVAVTFEEYGHPMINKTITVKNIDPSGVIFDSDGVGYRTSVELDGIGFNNLIKNHTYNITYFCDGGNTRRIAKAVDLTPPPPPAIPTQDPTKCQNVNGGCR